MAASPLLEITTVDLLNSPNRTNAIGRSVAREAGRKESNFIVETTLKFS